MFVRRTKYLLVFRGTFGLERRTPHRFSIDVRFPVAICPGRTARRGLAEGETAGVGAAGGPGGTLVYRSRIIDLVWTSSPARSR